MRSHLLVAGVAGLALAACSPTAKTQAAKAGDHVEAAAENAGAATVTAARDAVHATEKAAAKAGRKADAAADAAAKQH